MEGVDRAAQSLASLKGWLTDFAYPIWWTKGADHLSGGFCERLTQSAEAIPEPRRSRVQPRQIYAYAIAPELGWVGPSEKAVAHGLEFFLRCYARNDGFFRTLVSHDGTPIDDQAVLYDQAFALLGLAFAHDVLRQEALKSRALDLLTAIRCELRHPYKGFEESKPSIQPLLSNSHMHLLEACLAWADFDPLGPWLAVAEEIVDLAVACFIDSSTGFVLEFFDHHWNPISGRDERIVEPGHQYEWAWLLLKWNEIDKQTHVRYTAMNLIAGAEAYGWDPRREVVVNRLLTNKEVIDPQARLWPQTEKLKAMCAAALLTGDERYWFSADAAARALRAYLDTRVKGLWYDKVALDGCPIQEPAPASSFYHIVCAISELDRALARFSKQ
jgi:mannose-6-phosphate isomerase